MEANQPETTLGALLREKLSQWDKGTPEAKAAPAEKTKPQLFKPTNNVSRETFNTIRDNPGLLRVAIVHMLTLKGFKASSTTSLIGQMLTQNLVREIDGRLYAKQTEYTPLKSSYRTKQKAKAKKVIVVPRSKPVVKKDEGIAALPTAATAPVLVKPDWDAKTMIDHLSVRQARALYEELKSLFEEK